MKKALITASLMLAVGSTAACGGGDSESASAPKDASQGDFCAQFVKAPTAADGDSIKAWAKKAAEIGTPKELSDEARAGFELIIKEAADLDAGANADDFGNLEDFSEAEQKKVLAFSTYFATNCADEMEKSVEDLLPSDDAS